MTANTIDLKAPIDEMSEADLFDLDITFIESGGEAASLINLTDDGCGSTCPKACATNAG